MEHVERALTFVLWNAPVWAWLAVGGVLLVEDAIARSPWRSNSTIQLVAALLSLVAARVRGRFPSTEAVPTPVDPDKAPTEPTRPPSDHGAIALPALLVLGAIGFMIAMLLSGCAPSTDALRKACAGEERLAAGAYQTAASW